MAGPMTRWMQHSACIGLMLVVATACASGPGLPVAAKPASVVQQPAASGQRSSAGQQPADASSTQAKATASDEKPKPIDLCALTTADEMTGILGALKAGPVALKGPAGETLMCTFDGADGQEVTILGESPLSWGSIKYGSKMNGRDVDVSGFGNEALFGPSKEGDIYTLSISTDRVALHISVKGAADKAQALTVTEAVATKALARI